MKLDFHINYINPAKCNGCINPGHKKLVSVFYVVFVMSST